jgi:hypothetical protein
LAVVFQRPQAAREIDLGDAIDRFLQFVDAVAQRRNLCPLDSHCGI